jgi:hypothetical protein
MTEKLVFDCATALATTAELTTAELDQVEADQAAELEAQWARFRSERDRRLVACDWTQLPDTPHPPGEFDAWAAYRQELRDLPAETVDPANPDWPAPPDTARA